MKKVLFVSSLFVIVISWFFLLHEGEKRKTPVLTFLSENTVSGYSLPTSQIVWVKNKTVVLPPPPPDIQLPVPPSIDAVPFVAKKVLRDPSPVGKTALSPNGKRMCPKNLKDDHPSKSKHNKKGHMDMECCPDPDEIPNNNCDYSQYSVKKHGKWIIPFLAISDL